MVLVANRLRSIDLWLLEAISMMRRIKREARLWSAAFCATIPVALSGCSVQVVEPVPVPVTWEYSYEDGSVASIHLGSEGSGSISNVPFGFFEECESADPAEVEPLRAKDLDGMKLWSGDATWSETSAGRVEVETPSGSGVLWSDASGFGGDVTWTSVVIEICGADAEDYSTMRFFSFPG